MSWRASLLLLALASMAAVVPRLPGPASPGSKHEKGEISFSKQVVPLLTKHCTSCHGGNRPKAGLALDKHLADPKPLENRELWDRVYQYVRGREMPPDG